jgi:hypothetical protein
MTVSHDCLPRVTIRGDGLPGMAGRSGGADGSHGRGGSGRAGSAEKLGTDSDRTEHSRDSGTVGDARSAVSRHENSNQADADVR